MADKNAKFGESKIDKEKINKSESKLNKSPKKPSSVEGKLNRTDSKSKCKSVGKSKDSENGLKVSPSKVIPMTEVGRKSPATVGAKSASKKSRKKTKSVSKTKTRERNSKKSKKVASVKDTNAKKNTNENGSRKEIDKEDGLTKMVTTFVHNVKHFFGKETEPKLHNPSGSNSPKSVSHSRSRQQKSSLLSLSRHKIKGQQKHQEDFFEINVTGNDEVKAPNKYRPPKLPSMAPVTCHCQQNIAHKHNRSGAKVSSVKKTKSGSVMSIKNSKKNFECRI